MTSRHDAAVARMRREFDATFSAPARARDEAGEPLVLLRIAGDRLAVRTSTMSGLVKGRRIVPLPTRSASLLGVLGLRGRIVPVHDLARVLGRHTDPTTPEWIALGGTESPLGFAFADYEAHVVVHRDQIRSDAVAEGPATRAVVQLDEASVPLLDLRALSAALRGGTEEETRS